MFIVEAIAGIGLAFGLTPSQIDEVWDVMRNEMPAHKPSEAIRDFRWIAEGRGFLPASPPVPSPPMDVFQEQERMRLLREEIAGLGGSGAQ